MGSQCRRLLHFDSFRMTGTADYLRDEVFTIIANEKNFDFTWEEITVIIAMQCWNFMSVHFCSMCMCQMPLQRDGYSCGIIILHVIQRIVKYLFDTRFIPAQQSQMSAADLHLDLIVRTTSSYRRIVGDFLSAIFNSSYRSEEVQLAPNHEIDRTSATNKKRKINIDQGIHIDN